MLRNRLDLAAIQSVLLVANASITENIEDHGIDAHSNRYPFAYDLGDGVEISISSLTNPPLGLTWGELEIVVRGLWIYHIEGKRDRASFFDICDTEHEYVYPCIGWGMITKPLRLDSSNLTSISKREIRRSSAFQVG